MPHESARQHHDFCRSCAVLHPWLARVHRFDRYRPATHAGVERLLRHMAQPSASWCPGRKHSSASLPELAVSTHCCTASIGKPARPSAICFTKRLCVVVLRADRANAVACSSVGTGRTRGSVPEAPRKVTGRRHAAARVPAIAEDGSISSASSRNHRIFDEFVINGPLLDEITKKKNRTTSEI